MSCQMDSKHIGALTSMVSYFLFQFFLSSSLDSLVKKLGKADFNYLWITRC